MKIVKIISRTPIQNACGRGERVEWIGENGTKYISFYKEGEEIK